MTEDRSDPVTYSIGPVGGVPAPPAEEPATTCPSPDGSDDRARRRVVALAGHAGDEATARRAMADGDPQVRAIALGALARLGSLGEVQLVEALADRSPAVRRRACDLSAVTLAPTGGSRDGASAGCHGDAMAGATADARDRSTGSSSAVGDALRTVLDDVDTLVVESACWALGERRDSAAVAGLARVAREHPDARCREAAVAALGAVGDPAGCPTVLAALDDKPPVRRRAVVALAAFEGPEIDEALRRSLTDRDWQVREAAEILLSD